MTEGRYEDFRGRIEGRGRILSERMDVNVAHLHIAHAQFAQETRDIRAEIANLMTAARLLQREEPTA
jgi:hypothetical protein